MSGGYLRSLEAHNCHSNGRESGTIIGKPKTKLDKKFGNLMVVFFTKTESQMLTKGKSVTRNEHQNRKTDVFGAKTEKPI